MRQRANDSDQHREITPMTKTKLTSGLTLLSVGNPVYSRSELIAERRPVVGTKQIPPERDPDRVRDGSTEISSPPIRSSQSITGPATQIVGLTRRAIWTQSLPSLPGTADECHRLCSLFGPDRSTLLLGRDATESRVKALLPHFSIIHIAAHGLVDENFDNLFGGIALTPPESAPSGTTLPQTHSRGAASVSKNIPEHDSRQTRPIATNSPSEDGILSLHEIYELRLSRCRLAVLSACETSIGPDRPMEASSSLLREFLSSGARSVVASLWSVSDESTAELMSDFMRQYSQAANSEAFRSSFDAAAALQVARRKIRNTPKWNSPWYWAAFIISGNP
jgi:CHAT domain-containing protein